MKWIIIHIEYYFGLFDINSDNINNNLLYIFNFLFMHQMHNIYYHRFLVPNKIQFNKICKITYRYIFDMQRR